MPACGLRNSRIQLSDLRCIALGRHLIFRSQQRGRRQSRPLLHAVIGSVSHSPRNVRQARPTARSDHRAFVHPCGRIATRCRDPRRKAAILWQFCGLRMAVAGYAGLFGRPRGYGRATSDRRGTQSKARLFGFTSPAPSGSALNKEWLFARTCAEADFREIRFAGLRCADCQ